MAIDVDKTLRALALASPLGHGEKVVARGVGGGVGGGGIGVGGGGGSGRGGRAGGCVGSSRWGCTREGAGLGRLHACFFAIGHGEFSK